MANIDNSGLAPSDDIAGSSFPLGGFAPRLPDDTVEYEIRLLDQATSEKEIRQELLKIQAAGTALAKKLLRGYIWQREGFALEVTREGTTPYLRGRMSYGDSVEDEWVVVYLLRELSRQFTEAWVRVTDSDGEFLLIEAANVLPKWVNPDVAEHRVWMNRGDLLLIPPSPAGRSASKSVAPTSKQPATFLSLPQALTVLRRPRSELVHSPLIEAEAFYRLRNYPAQIQANFHHALVRIPRRLAFILHHLPTSVSHATEAFYLRDPVALRPLQEHASQDLLFTPSDCVTARVKFPKLGYAQLRAQRFTGIGAWAEAVQPDSGTRAKEHERRDVGMKLSCGFEMLVADAQNQDRPAVREIKLLLEDLEQDAEALPTDAEVAAWGLAEDDDSWLDIDFRDFDDELVGRRRGAGTAAQGTEPQTTRRGFGDAAAQQNLQKLVARFEDFLNDDELADDDDNEAGDDEEAGGEDPGEDKAASFDEDEFTALMREMMGLPAEAMREMMGPHAAGATGLTDREHPDFTQGGQELQDRMQKLFEAMDIAAGEATEGMQQSDAQGKETGGKPQDRAEPPLQHADEDDDAIRNLTAQMEAELRGTGALKLANPNAKKPKSAATKSLTGQHAANQDQDDSEEDDEDDDESELLDEDYNLVANMLRSFGGQAGAAGPAGNMMGMLGVRMPRDDGESDDDNDDEGGSSRGTRQAAENRTKGKGEARLEELE